MTGLFEERSREEFEEHIRRLRQAADAMEKMADAHEEAMEQCDTAEEADEYLRDAMDSMPDEQSNALEHLGI